MAGRKTSLTEDLIVRIVLLIQGGNYRQVAAKACGVPLSTWHHWLARGREERERGESSVYVTLLEAVHDAEAAAELGMVATVMRAALLDPKYALEYLQRKHPERWARDTGRLRDVEKALRDLEKRLATNGPAAAPPRSPGGAA